MPTVRLRCHACEVGVKLGEMIDHVIGDPPDCLVRRKDATVDRDRDPIPRGPSLGEPENVADQLGDRLGGVTVIDWRALAHDLGLLSLRMD
jgi:hypothetical protein